MRFKHPGHRVQNRKEILQVIPVTGRARSCTPDSAGTPQEGARKSRALPCNFQSREPEWCADIVMGRLHLPKHKEKLWGGCQDPLCPEVTVG